MEYYSQFGQDKFLDQKIFKGKNSGFFVEIGADDGIKHSNTYFFEKFRDWKGICIEPRKKSFDKLVKNRSAICENCCISDTTGTKKFLEIPGHKEQWSGLLEKFDHRQLDKINEIIDKEVFNKNIIEVECNSLNDIISKHNIKHIDYLSIDTEGGEIDILKSIDFSKIKIDVISVENNHRTNEAKKILRKNNYKIVNKLTIDDVFIRKYSSVYNYVYTFDYVKTTIRNCFKEILRSIKDLIPEKIKILIRKKHYATNY